MKPLNGEFSVVVLGAWNPSIFSPQWIEANLIDAGVNAEIQIAVPLEDPTAPRKISFQDISLFPGRKKMDLIPDEAKEDRLVFCSDVLLKTFELLPHTPVSGFGINFGFIETNLTEQLTNLFDLSDEVRLLDAYVTKESSILRKIQKENEKYVINLTLSENDGTVTIRLNFHFDENTIDACTAILNGNAIQNCYSEAIELLNNVYGLELDD